MLIIKSNHDNHLMVNQSGAALPPVVITPLPDFIQRFWPPARVLVFCILVPVIVVLTTLMTSAEGPAVLPDIVTGLMGYWALDGGSGGIASDSSGNGNSGTLQNGPTWTAGKIAAALRLDGVNDHVKIPHSNSLNIGGTRITLSAWIRFESTGTWQTVLAKVDADNTFTAPYFTYMLGVSSANKARMFVGVSGTTEYTDVRSQQTLTTGTWYHLAGVYDGVQLKIYVNGVLDGSKAESRAIAQRTSSVRIGVGGTVNEPLKGLVDDVRIYNRALSGVDVSALYSYTLPTPPPPDIVTGLRGYWALDEGSGGIASDSSGNGNSGTLQNGPTWTAGKIAAALRLDGVNDHVKIPHSNSLNIGGTRITLSAWIRFESTGTWQTVLAKVDADNTFTAPYFTYLLGVSSANKARMFVGVSGTTEYTDVRSQQTLTTGTWYHLAGVYDGVQLKIYVNGVLDGSKAESRAIAQRTSSVRIGVGGTVNEPLKGLVDGVRIYNRALSGVDVSALYSYTLPTPPPPDTQRPSIPTGLIGHAVSSSQIDLAWTGSTDNVGVVNYRLYRNGNQIATTTPTNYANTGLSPSTSYSYTVAAFDAAGNASPQSGSVLVVTPTASAPPAVTWSAPMAISGAPYVSTTITGDFNGDGVTDIAAFEGGKHSDGAKLFAWFESPTFIKRNLNTGFSTKEFIGSAAAADINRDGRLDIVFTMDHHSGATQEGWVYWAENPGGSATGNWPIHLIRYFSSGTEHINDMVVDDIDGDGKLDVVIRHLGVNRVRILFQNTLSSWSLVTRAVKPREGLSVADLDEDGRKDLLLNGFWLAAPLNARTGTWTEYSIDPTFYTQPDTGLNNAAKTGVGDIDGDGRVDVVMATAEGATGKLAWYRNPGNPRTQSWTAHVLEPSITDMHQAELGDIDLDGDLDVLSGRRFDNGVYIYLLNGQDFVKQIVVSNKGLYFGKLADLDGDGDLDIVGPTRYARQLYVYKNKLSDGP